MLRSSGAWRRIAPTPHDHLTWPSPSASPPSLGLKPLRDTPGPDVIRPRSRVVRSRWGIEASWLWVVRQSYRWRWRAGRAGCLSVALDRREPAGDRRRGAAEDECDGRCVAL